MLFMFHIMKVLVENSQYPAAFLLRKMFLRVQDHSREMNSRATPLKFVCPRISHYAFSQPVNCIFWPIETLNWLVVASKLHKHRGTCYTAEWPYCPFAILDPTFFHVWFESRFESHCYTGIENCELKSVYMVWNKVDVSSDFETTSYIKEK